jgi:hypothetical protein
MAMLMPAASQRNKIDIESILVGPTVLHSDGSPKPAMDRIAPLEPAYFHGFVDSFRQGRGSLPRVKPALESIRFCE